MQNSEINIGKDVWIYKSRGLGFRDLTLYGQICAVRRHWNGNPDLLEIQIEGLEIWIALDESVQVTLDSPEIGVADDCA